MKKSLFGYNIKETDNLFNSMQNHIDVLTGKITNLNAELSAKSNAVVNNDEYEHKIAQLKEKMAQIENENANLKRELSNARQKTEIKPEHKPEVPVESGKKVEYIGKIYLTAYEDAEKIKKGAMQEADEYLKQFVSVKRETKQKLANTLAEIREQQINMESLLNESVQHIVESLRDFGFQSDRMSEKIKELDDTLAVSATPQNN